ncbi:MAG: ABC transporter ATP-binding protein/permease [Planctomycetes bacterium]|nr:ABC transporter ATP-binding protein/permease [Planctomycetota bacterium]
MNEPDDHFEEKDPPRPAVRRTFRRLLPWLRPHRRTLLVALFTVLVITACQLAGPFFFGRTVNAIEKDLGMETVVLLAGAFFASFLVAAGVGYAQGLMLTRMGIRVVTAIKERVFGHLLSLSVKFHESNPVGKLIARTEGDAETVKELFSRVAISILQSALAFVATLTTMLVVSFRTSFVLLLVLPVMALGAAWFFRVIRGVYRELRRRFAELSGMITEYVQGVPVVQQFDQKERALRLLDERNRAKFRTEMRSWYLDYGFWGAFLFVEVLAGVAILWFGAKGILAAAIDVGTLLMFLEYTRRVFEPIIHFGEQLTQVQRGLASADRVFDLLDTPPEVADAPGAAEEASFTREIRFEDVSFSYDGVDKVLDGVSFTVRRGERVALVGPSGGGKTTLVSLLCRFLDPTGGRVLLDGRDLREFTQRAWRERIGLVLQEIYLFPGTVLDNLRVLDEDVAPERVEAAARAVTADSFIEALPERYGADLAERGTNLSLGERQILSFARALAAEPDLLVLDEATSSVDPGTEERIQVSLERLLTGRTAVIVAHRLSTIRGADRILVVRKGRIEEEGDHDTLLARGGLYRELWDLQSAGNGNGRPEARP